MKKFALPFLSIPVLGVVALLSGCSASVGNYETPAHVNETLLADSELGVAAEFRKNPASEFPAHIAVARMVIHDTRIVSRHEFGHVNYGARPVELIESPEHAAIVELLGAQPGVAGVASINVLLLPKDEKNALMALRKAAAKIHADMVLAYVVTSGSRDDDYAPFLTFITLGLAPTQDLSAKANVAGVLLDVRTGYVYGVINASAEDATWSIGWTSRGIAKDLRSDVEADVFKKFAEAIPTSWKSVNGRYSGGKVPVPVVIESETPVAASH